MLDKTELITFEIVGHYPDMIVDRLPNGDYEIIQEDPNAGTFHAYWVEMEMDLRGCYYSYRTATSLYIAVPSRNAIDKESKKHVRYPEMSFTDQEYNSKFRQTLKEAFIKYAAKKYLSYNANVVKERFLLPKFIRKDMRPETRSGIKSTGTFTKYTDFKDKQSKTF